MKDIHKALTFRASSIGDALMGKYFLENIHANFPHARLGMIVGKRAGMLRDLFAAYPYIEIIEANRKNPRSLWNLYRDWKESDLVLTQYAGKKGGMFSLGSKLFGALLAKPAGFFGFQDVSWVNRHVYDTIIPFERDEAPAALERRALRAIHIPVAHAVPSISFEVLRGVKEKFGIVGPYAIAHLFAGNKGRGMSPQKKRALLETLCREFPQINFVVSGGKEDAGEVAELIQNLPITSIAGKATLQELMNLLSESVFVVSVDTGVAHISAQLRKPMVVLGSCLGVHWWGKEQYGEGTRISILSKPEPGGHVNKNYPACMADIEPHEVARAISEIVS